MEACAYILVVGKRCALLASDRGRAPVFRVTPYLGLNFPIADDARISSTYRAALHVTLPNTDIREALHRARHLCDFLELAREG
jgi:hypothetical protein